MCVFVWEKSRASWKTDRWMGLSMLDEGGGRKGLVPLGAVDKKEGMRRCIGDLGVNGSERGPCHNVKMIGAAARPIVADRSSDNWDRRFLFPRLFHDEQSIIRFFFGGLIKRELAKSGGFLFSRGARFWGESRWAAFVRAAVLIMSPRMSLFFIPRHVKKGHRYCPRVWLTRSNGPNVLYNVSLFFFFAEEGRRTTHVVCWENRHTHPINQSINQSIEKWVGGLLK